MVAIEKKQMMCPTCNGSGEGKHEGEKCSTCKGVGTVWELIKVNPVVEGWRDPREWDDPPEVSSNVVNRLFEVVKRCHQSHDGWYCPHCNFKETLPDAELEGSEYTSLIEGYDPIELYCRGCDKVYYLRAFVVRKYTTCADDKFKE